MISEYGFRAPGPRGTGAAVRTLLCMMACALSFTGAPAAAQDPVPDTAEVVPLPPVVARVLRVPVQLDRLPLAVTVRDPQRTPPTAGLTLATQLAAVPGLQVQSRYNEALGDRIVIRGFGARTQFGVRGVQVVVDGVPATMPDGQTTLNHLDLTLLERAEVLRGAAAATWGNAAGGALVLTTRPAPARLRQEVEGTVGGLGLLRIRSSTGGGLGDSGGWIASITREGRDGFRPHSETEKYQLTGRANGQVAGGVLTAAVHGVVYDALNPGSLTPDQFAEDFRQAQAFNVTQRTGEEGTHGQIGASWSRPFDGWRAEAGVYALRRSLDNPIPPAIIDLDRIATGGRLAVRTDPASDEGLLLSAGLDWGVQWDDRANFENQGGARGALTLSQEERVLDTGLHAQAVWSLAQPLDLLLAVRYDRVAFRAEDDLTGPGDPDDSGRRTMDAFSPAAGLTLEVGGGVRLFGNVATAFETPTTTELVNRPEGAGGFNPELDPQRTVSWEAGARARLGRRLRLEATAYRAGIRDALIPFEVPAAPGRQFFRNAGEAVHRGVEVMGELQSARFELLTALAVTDAEFTEYRNEDGAFAGNDVPGVRPWTFESRLVVRPWALTRSRATAGSAAPGPAALTLELRAAGEMAVDDANTATAPGYEVIGARIGGASREAGGWTFAPYAGVENLLDQRYVASVVPNAFGGRYYEPGPGRFFYAGVRVGVSAGP